MYLATTRLIIPTTVCLSRHNRAVFNSQGKRTVHLQFREPSITPPGPRDFFPQKSITQSSKVANVTTQVLSKEIENRIVEHPSEKENLTELKYNTDGTIIYKDYFRVW